MQKARKPQIESVADHIAWSYANLARVDAALRDGVTSYKRVHHIIRAKLFRGLTDGTMAMRSLYDDERLKMTAPRACCYCGCTDPLSVDHLIPRIRGGRDEADNLVLACQSCNSSKRGRDMLDWMRIRQTFPAVLLLRRYIKLVARYCEEKELLSTSIKEVSLENLPFDLSLLPYSFPPLTELQRWVMPGTQPSNGSAEGDSRER